MQKELAYILIKTIITNESDFMYLRNKKYLTLLFFLLLIVVLFYSFRNKLLGADSNQEILSQQDAKINILGQEKVFYLQKLKAGEIQKYQLVLISNFKREKIELPGFEDDVTFCEQKSYQLSVRPEKAALCIVGNVGAHSQNVVFVNIEQDKLSYVPFLVDNKVLTNLSSDVPSIIAKQSTDGVLEVWVDNRDYDSDPVNRSVRTIFKWNGLGLVFDRSQNIQYDKIN